MFSKVNLSNIPKEETSHSNGARKIVLDKQDTTSKYFEACTYGYLSPGEKWEMHKHDNIIEICIVTKGMGIIRDSNENEESFVSGDRFVFPSDTEHEIENTGEDIAEFYFFRVQNQ